MSSQEVSTHGASVCVFVRLCICSQLYTLPFSPGLHYLCVELSFSMSRDRGFVRKLWYIECDTQRLSLHGVTFTIVESAWRLNAG